MEFDDIIEYVGGLSYYQFSLFLMLLIHEFLGAEAMAMNFIGGNQEHWCKVPELQMFSFQRQKLIAIPKDSSGSRNSQCKMFPLNYSSYTIDDLLQWNETDRQKVEATYPNVNSYSDCRNGWVFDKSLFVSTINNEWNLVCGRSWTIQLVSSIYMGGRFFGAISAGIFSDKWGRKPAIVIFSMIKLIGGYLATFANSFVLFCVGRFILALGTTGLGVAAYVLLQEIIDKKHRALVGMTLTTFFSLGFSVLPGIAYFIRDHRIFQFVYVTPGVILLSYIFLLDESPRWLISQGLYEKALKILNKVAAVNGRSLPENIAFNTKKNEHRQGKFIDLFRTPNLRKKTLIMSLLWFTCSLMYYGLSLNTGQLAGNIFLNTFLSAFIEVPSKLLAIWLLTKGRRPTVGFGLIFAGTLSIALIPLIMTNTPAGYRTAVAIISKSGVSIAFGSIYIYSVELFPTGVRNVGLGFGSMTARISGMASPYIGGPLSNVWKPLPTTIFGLFATLSGLFTFLLPETLNRKLPETIEEGENFGKSINVIEKDMKMDKR